MPFTIIYYDPAGAAALAAFLTSWGGTSYGCGVCGVDGSTFGSWGCVDGGGYAYPNAAGMVDNDTNYHGSGGILDSYGNYYPYGLLSTAGSFGSSGIVDDSGIYHANGMVDQGGNFYDYGILYPGAWFGGSWGILDGDGNYYGYGALTIEGSFGGSSGIIDGSGNYHSYGVLDSGGTAHDGSACLNSEGDYESYSDVEAVGQSAQTLADIGTVNSHAAEIEKGHVVLPGSNPGVLTGGGGQLARLRGGAGGGP